MKKKTSGSTILFVMYLFSLFLECTKCVFIKLLRHQFLYEKCSFQYSLIYPLWKWRSFLCITMLITRRVDVDWLIGLAGHRLIWGYCFYECIYFIYNTPPFRIWDVIFLWLFLRIWLFWVTGVVVFFFPFLSWFLFMVDEGLSSFYLLISCF